MTTIAWVSVHGLHFFFCLNYIAYKIDGFGTILQITTVLVCTNLFLFAFFFGAEEEILYIIHLIAMYRNKKTSWLLTNI